MNETQYLKLKLPGKSDFVLVEVLNDNFTKIDQSIMSGVYTISELQKLVKELDLKIENIDVSEELEDLKDEILPLLDSKVGSVNNIKPDSNSNVKLTGESIAVDKSNTNSISNELQTIRTSFEDELKLKANESDLPTNLNDLHVSESWKAPAGSVVEGLQNHKAEKTYVKEEIEKQTLKNKTQDEQIDEISKALVESGNSMTQSIQELSDKKLDTTKFNSEIRNIKKLIDESDNVHLEKYTESKLPNAFSPGITITNNGGSDFPSIGQFGSCITFKHDTNRPVQIYVDVDGYLSGRRATSTTSWGSWYKSRDVAKKSQAVVVDKLGSISNYDEGDIIIVTG